MIESRTGHLKQSSEIPSSMNGLSAAGHHENALTASKAGGIGWLIISR